MAKSGEEKTYLLKSWREGRECDPGSETDICRAMEGLAIFHTVSKGAWQFLTENEREKNEGPHLEEEFRKRTRELKKVQNFIRKKQKKTEFERCYLEVVPEFLGQALEIIESMQQSGYDGLRSQALGEGFICHGEYHQHNVYFDRSGLVLANFDHARLDLPCMDVALFLRKIMEKQGWKTSLGERALKAYEVVRPMSGQERKILGFCFAYPEKLWKIANHYYHTNKAWIPAKDLEKLKTFANQQKDRERFVQQVIL